jgi:hypothetical protein
VGRTCSTQGGEERCVQDFGLEAVGKKPLGRPRRKWEDNIKMNLRDRWGELDSAGSG